MAWIKKARKIKRYVELTWDYPMPYGTPLLYNFNTTNNPRDCDRSMGNGGRGYMVFDLHDAEQRQRFMNMREDFFLVESINNALEKAGFDVNEDGSLNPERYFQFLDQKK